MKSGCVETPESSKERPHSEQSHQPAAGSTGRSGFPSRKDFLPWEDHCKPLAVSIFSKSMTVCRLHSHTSAHGLFQDTKGSSEHTLCSSTHSSADEFGLWWKEEIRINASTRQMQTSLGGIQIQGTNKQPPRGRCPARSEYSKGKLNKCVCAWPQASKQSKTPVIPSASALQDSQAQQQN